MNPINSFARMNCGIVARVWLVSFCKMAAVWLWCRCWFWVYAENSWWSFTRPDNAVHGNTIRTRDSIGGTASEPESTDDSVERQCRWTAAGSERTVSHTRRIYLRSWCNCSSWPQFVQSLSTFCFNWRCIRRSQETKHSFSDRSIER